MQDYIEETSSGIYRITSEGKIFSQSKLKITIVSTGMEHTGEFKVIIKPERELTYTTNNRGYYSVGIQKKTYMVHRLIAKLYVPNPEKKKYVNHIDGNKLNNHYSNLEWCTISENNKHARDTGLWSAKKLKKSKTYKSTETKKKCLANLKDKSKLSDDDVRWVREHHVPRTKNYSATALAKKFKVSVAAMCKIVSGETYQHVK